MLEGLEALIALERFGTVSEAAAHLRLTQSAVSKRIQGLRDELGFPLTAPEGRRLRLTPEAQSYLERARPLVAELKSLARSPVAEGPSELSLALADSIAASWGPAVLKKATRAHGPRLRLHAHRSVLVLESVRLGRYDAGLCALAAPPKDLVAFEMTSEPFVLVHAGLGDRMDADLPLITIETGSATWKAIDSQVAARADLHGREFVRVESFAAALQMAKAGFGNALVPLGLVREAKIAADAGRPLRLRRPLFLVTRKNTSQTKAFETLRQNLALTLKDFFRD